MKNSFRILLASSCLIAISVGVNAQQTSSLADRSSTLDIPRTISYQASLSDANGNPVKDGDYVIHTRLYSDSKGNNTLWQDSYRVHVVHGVVNLNLGSGTTPLPSPAAMNTALWVGIQIDGTEEMKDYAQLSAVPYAMNVPDASITPKKMAMDYVGSITINGQKISTHGGDINITTGEGITASIDPATNAVVLKTDAAAGNATKGEAAQGNTSIVGTLYVSGACNFTATSGNTVFGGTGAVTLPKGTTGQQPSPVAGMIRYNTTTNHFEGYNGSTWKQLDN